MCVPIYNIRIKWRLQTALSAKHCFHHANGNVTTIVAWTNAYEINHIWELRKWNRKKNDPRSCERNLCNCVRSLKKRSGLQRDLNPWPRSNQLIYEATDSPIVFLTLKTMVCIQSTVCIFYCPPIYTLRIGQDMSILFF